MNRVSILLLLALNGCYSMGQQKITNEKLVSKIVEGKTTKAEVLKLVGRPMAVDFTEGGEKWVYMYTYAAVRGTTFIPIVGMFAGGSDSQTDTMTIIFTKDGIVEKIGRGQMVGGGGGLQDAGRDPKESQPVDDKPTSNPGIKRGANDPPPSVRNPD